MPPSAKHPLKSKLILFALGLLAYGFHGVYFQCTHDVPTPLTFSADAATDQAVDMGPWVGLISSIIIMVLRYYTNQPLDLSFFKDLITSNRDRDNDPDDDPEDDGITAPPIYPLFPKSGAAVGLILLMGGAAFASPPRAVINGPTTAVAGDQILLDASDAHGDQVRWEVRRRDGGTALYKTSPDNRQLRLNSYPGIYDVRQTVANSDGIDFAEQTVTVYNASMPGPKPPAPQPAPEPEPTPGPTPGPTPEPAPVPPTPAPPAPLPAGQFNVSQKTFDQAKLVSSSTAKEDAARIADAIRGVSAAVSAGTLKSTRTLGQYDPRPITNELSAATARGIGANGPAWSGFGKWLATEIESLWSAGKLKTDSDFATLFLEIALGLAALK